MLRTNSKEVKNKIREFVTICYNEGAENYDFNQTNNWDIVKLNVLATFENEKLLYCQKGYYKSYFEAFRDWASGLPSLIATEEYYLKSAIDWVANLLEETPTEAQKYSEKEAERLADWLIFRELTTNHTFINEI